MASGSLTLGRYLVQLCDEIIPCSCLFHSVFPWRASLTWSASSRSCPWLGLSPLPFAWAACPPSSALAPRWPLREQRRPAGPRAGVVGSALRRRGGFMFRDRALFAADGRAC